MKNLKGRVAFVFTEDDFDVDQIVGVKNIKLRDPAELAAVAMQAYDPAFSQQVRPARLNALIFKVGVGAVSVAVDDLSA